LDLGEDRHVCIVHGARGESPRDRATMLIIGR